MGMGVMLGAILVAIVGLGILWFVVFGGRMPGTAAPTTNNTTNTTNVQPGATQPAGATAASQNTQVPQATSRPPATSAPQATAAVPTRTAP